MQNNTILLVDGYSLIYRAFHALPPLSSNGVPVNAVHGFLSMLFNAMEKYAPKAVYVMMDEKGPTFRHKQYKEYKAGRPPMPELLKPQFAVIKELMESMGIPTISKAGFEADDLLGTVSKAVAQDGVESIILTGDRDSFQLISDKTKVLFTKRGISSSLLLDPDGVLENYGYTPEQVTDLKGLMGDNSDNIPGIRGVGEKTALKLIDKYKTLENTLDHADEIKGKLGEKIREQKESARFSKVLATIVYDAPIEIDAQVQNIDKMLLGLPCLKKYELSRMAKQLNTMFEKGAYSQVAAKAAPKDWNKTTQSSAESIDLEENAWKSVNKIFMAQDGNKGKNSLLEADIPEIKQKLNIEDIDVLIIETEKIADNSLIAVCYNEEEAEFSIFTQDGVYLTIPCIVNMLSNGIDIDAIIIALAPLFNRCKLILHGQKNFMNLVYEYTKQAPEGCIWDTLIAAYLENPSSKQPELKLLCMPQKADAFAIYGLAQNQFKQLKNKGSLLLAEKMEFPLTRVLFSMEKTGFMLDRDVLTQLSVLFKQQIADYRKEVYDACGTDDFNINSPKQLSEVLFETLGLPHGKKTKSGFSTGAETLEKLKPFHPCIEPLIEYRKINKLNNTYIDTLLKQTARTERIHTRFDQTGTVTGRISSLEPNLQNIPIRSQEGREIRKAFVADKGFVLLDADYSQIELRILAHLSRDKTMIEAFTNNKDIHRATAAEVFGVPEDEVDSTMRSNAKAVNFGLVYGISAFGLSNNINVSVGEAAGFIERYFERYPGVHVFMEKCVSDGREKGFAQTLFMRRRDLPELLSSNRIQQNFGKRIAMNTPVQGTAADIIKLAMVRVQSELKDKYPQARLILQVHDELIIECPEDISEEVSVLLKNTMETIVNLRVPLLADVGISKSWYDAKA